MDNYENNGGHCEIDRAYLGKNYSTFGLYVKCYQSFIAVQYGANKNKNGDKVEKFLRGFGKAHKLCTRKFKKRSK